MSVEIPSHDHPHRVSDVLNRAQQTRREFNRHLGGAVLTGGRLAKDVLTSTHTLHAVEGLIVAGGALVVADVTTDTPLTLPFIDRKSYKQMKAESGPYTEGEMLPEGNFIVKGSSLEVNPLWLSDWLQVQENHYNAINRPPEERPLDYTFRLVTEDQQVDIQGNDLTPSITVTADGLVTDIKNSLFTYDEEGNFQGAWLEALPSEASRANLYTSVTYPDGTIIPEGPNVIDFPNYKFPNDANSETAIYSSERIDQFRMEHVYPLLEATEAFTGEPIQASLYDTAYPKPLTGIPPTPRGVARDMAVIPDFIINEAVKDGNEISIELADITSAHEVFRAVYRNISTINPRYQGIPIAARAAFETGIKRYVDSVRDSRLQKLNETPDTEAVLKAATSFEADLGNDETLGFFDINKYLPQDLQSTYDFGDLVHNPEAFFASALTIRRFWGEQFYNDTDPEEYSYPDRVPRLVVGQINTSIDTLLNSINEDKALQEQFVGYIDDGKRTSRYDPVDLSGMYDQ